MQNELDGDTVLGACLCVCICLFVFHAYLYIFFPMSEIVSDGTDQPVVVTADLSWVLHINFHGCIILTFLSVRIN